MDFVAGTAAERACAFGARRLQRDVRIADTGAERLVRRERGRAKRCVALERRAAATAVTLNRAEQQRQSTGEEEAIGDATNAV
jgi:hypothetical protein